MRKIVYLMTICIVSILGCSGEENLNDYNVLLENEGNTYQTGEFIPLKVIVEDPSGEPVSVDDIFLYMNMERMNHPMQGTMEEQDQGMYIIELPLAMGGEWYVDVLIKDGKKEREERFYIHGEGEMVMEYMMGYNKDEERKSSSE
ncbi:FixH family protein [Evansella tamaricis]|uniref:FixH family protein n=1 Tax=Evansella tamaricis TaxID=2069301 RepID=A0ABS6JCQ5_9BACI|nr:FixH family protein [Evansella tamaricis]MBU9711445.1 FixH family protein [Evansella tamaricis]